MRNWKLMVAFTLIIILVGYLSYQKGFESGRDYTAQTDSVNPKRWVNKKWGYEITFPGQWDSIKRHDPSIKSVGTDVFCSNKSGASTAVFVSTLMPNYTIDNATDEILNQYKKLGELTIIDKRDYAKDTFSYRTIVFKQMEYMQHYTIIFTRKNNCSD